MKENLKETNENISTEGVTYRKSPTWRIALSQMNNGSATCFYVLMGYASYCANQGYGILTAIVGIILTCTRIFDAITDPLVALILDKMNTRFGKIRIMLGIGWAIEAISVKFLFDWASGQGHGLGFFVITYLVYVVGYTMQNVTGQIIGPVLTNDPKQRPQVGVWSTVFGYLVPTILTVIIMFVLLPKYNNEYSVPMLAEASTITVIISFIMVVLVMIGVSEADKPENFIGLDGTYQKITFKDMKTALTGNKPLQMYIVAASSDKIAQTVANQSIITTMLYGIVIGNMQISTILSAIAMVPGVVFAAFAAKYAGNNGNKETVSLWAKVCIAVAAVIIIFFNVVDTKSIAKFGLSMVIFVVLQIILNGSKMCISTANGGMMADVVDWQYEKSGKYIPGVVSATYSFLDKLISSLGATIATACVALIGYTSTMPQPTDELTRPIFIMTIALYYGLPIIGWICSVFAMKASPLSKEAMVEVQRNIAEKKGKMEL